MSTAHTTWTISQVKNILFPTDFSRDSEYAMSYVFALAKDLDARVDLLHVIDTSSRVQQFGQPAVRRPGYTIEDEVEGALESLLSRALECGVKAKRHMRSGHIDEEVNRLADELAADMVIMAAGERLNTDQLLVSRYVKTLRNCDVPVLGVKHPEHEFVDESTLSLSIKKVLCPCDLTELSHQAVPIAAEMCRHFGAELVLGHVAHTFEEYSALEGKGGTTDNPVDTHEVLSRLTSQHPDVPSRIVAIKGDRKSALIDLCKDEVFDLVAMATHGHKSVMTSLMKTFTEEFLVFVPCPIMTIRPERMAERFPA